MIWKWNDNEKLHIKTKQSHRKHYKKEQLRDLCFSHFYIIKYGKMLFRKVIRTFRVHHCKVSVFNLNTRTAEGASSGWILARLTVKISDHLKTLPGRLILNGDMGTINGMEPYGTIPGEKGTVGQWTKGGHAISYYSKLTWCILHSYHEGLVFQEVLIVLDNIWMVEQFQDLTLVLSCQTFISWHLLHWDLLQDDKGPVTAPAAEVDDSDRRGKLIQLCE